MGISRSQLITHPLTVAAVTLLVLNDHVLKQQWPGVVTGKLSDIAGVWMVGALVVAATGSARWGTSLTALAFAALKTVPAVGVLAAPLLGGPTLRDRSDLVALLVLWPLGGLATRQGAVASTRVHDGWGTIGAVFVVLGAVFATSATSCSPGSAVSEVALDAQGRVLAHYASVDDPEDDGWYVMSAAAPVRVVDAKPVGVIAKQQCVNEGCYRVARDAVMLDDVVVFAYSRERAQAVAEQVAGCGTSAFQSLVAVESAAGTDVWVAMGVAGALHRTPDGKWHELTMFRAKPPATGTQRRASHAVVWVLPLIVAALVAVLVPICCGRYRRRTKAWAVGLGVTANLAWAAMAWWVVAPRAGEAGLFGLAGWFFAGIAPLVLVQFAWLIPVLVGRPSPPAVPVGPWRAPGAWWPQGWPAGPPPPPRPPAAPEGTGAPDATEVPAVPALPPEDRSASFN